MERYDHSRVLPPPVWRRCRLAIASAVIWAALSSSASAAQQSLKVYISADLEGVVGVVTGEQLGPEGFEYGRFREFMTREVLAAIEGAREAGATEFVVSDSHGNGQNLLLELFPRGVTVVRSWPRPLGMMEGIDESFDAAIFIGYHAGTTNPAGVRAHTMSSATFADVALNGRSALEAGINAAIAGHFGVPVVMISGDDAAVEEARAFIGDIEGAVVKWNYGFHAARTMIPEDAYALIRERAKTALGHLSRYTPLRLDGPVTLDIRFKNYRPAEVLSYLRIVERTGSHTIRFVGQDIIDVSRFLEFLTNYNAGLTP
jgi:D-amino peptidase